MSPEPVLMPLYGFVEGDTLGLLILAHDTDTILEVAEKLRSMANVRTRSGPDWRLIHKGEALRPDQSVAEAGIKALERVDLRRHPD